MTPTNIFQGRESGIKPCPEAPSIKESRLIPLAIRPVSNSFTNAVRPQIIPTGIEGQSDEARPISNSFNNVVRPQIFSSGIDDKSSNNDTRKTQKDQSSKQRTTVIDLLGTSTQSGDQKSSLPTSSNLADKGKLNEGTEKREPKSANKAYQNRQTHQKRAILGTQVKKLSRREAKKEVTVVIDDRGSDLESAGADLESNCC